MSDPGAFWRLFHGRVSAYRRVFGAEADKAGRLGRDAQLVLADLRQFCCVERGTAQYDGAGRLDPCATAKNEGRREVYERIVGALRLSEDEIKRVRAVAHINQED